MASLVQLPFEETPPLRAAPRLRALPRRSAGPDRAASRLLPAHPRFPGMSLAVPPGELTLNRDTLTGGLARLPVAW